MDKKALAKRINVSLATVYNWEKEKPELIKLIKNGLMFERGEVKNNELQIFFDKLNEEEQEMYLSEMKARILRKKLN